MLRWLPENISTYGGGRLRLWPHRDDGSSRGPHPRGVRGISQEAVAKARCSAGVARRAGRGLVSSSYGEDEGESLQSIPPVPAALSPSPHKVRSVPCQTVYPAR